MRGVFRRFREALRWAVLAAGLMACGGGETGGPPSSATSPQADAAPTGTTPDGSSPSDASLDGASPDGEAPDADVPIGAPCIPGQESLATFSGFVLNEVGLETMNASCGGKACLINHFQGRVTCPYGQDASGKAPPPASACTVPGTSTPVQPSPASPVEPACANRPAATAVTCSCRCANSQGNTDDDNTYCACPSGTVCAQAVSGFGVDDPLAGAYCVPAAAVVDGGPSCTTLCDPTLGNCPAPDAGAP